MSDRNSFPQQPREHPEIAARFGDYHPPFEPQAAITESNRCLFCFDAPCTTACPTHINVPQFIKRIATDNLSGSARTILESNILGASCARACPVEVLCEGACVMHRYNKEPIQIARLQRHAMDNFHQSGAPLPFEPGPDTGLSVALIGAGPASLACAAELRRRGIRAHIYDARPLPGGLNTYGVAEYKLPFAESIREINMLRQLGIEFHMQTTIDATRLAELERSHDAIFLGIGLGAIQKLGIGGEELPHVTNALDLIAAYKSGQLTTVPARVAVVGAGNTAIDAAIASVRLGATEVHIVYRRGPQQMSAFAFEYEHARSEGVKFLWHVQPSIIIGFGAAEGLKLTKLIPSEDGSLVPQPDSEFTLATDLIVLAIGQATHATTLTNTPNPAKIQLYRGRIIIDRATGQTSNPKFFAGGDCTNGGREVVDAVADGKRAGIGIAAWLEAQHAKA
jgi:glutamate synthase (NADPH/NADH) small chain